MYNDDISLATGGHSPLSSQSHFSPRLLTPDIDAEHQNHYRPPMTVHSDMDDPDTSHAHGLSFVKQPIAPVRAVSVKKGFAGPVRNASASSSRRTSSRGPAGLTDNEGLSDGALSVPGRAREGDVHRGSPTKNGQVSLLSAIMSSPEHGSVKGLGRPHTAPVSGPNALAGSGILSSNPSTALSSPTSTGAHGILRRTTSHHDASTDVDAPPANQPLGQDKPHGILRRGSMSGAECLGPAFAHTHSNNTGRSIGTSKLLESKLIQADEERRVKEGKIGWADDVFRPETAALVRAPSANSATGRPALKFAMAAKPVHAPSHGSTSASEAGDESRRSSSSRRAVSPFTKDNSARERLESDRPAPPRSEEDEDEEEAEEEDEDEDEEEESPPAHLPGYIPHPTPGLHVRPALAPLEYESDGSSDAGYEEDEEDGMFSEEDETTGIDLDRIRPSTGKFPFARSTNYWNRRESRENTSPGTSPPPAPAPAFILPPNRRGRGHIRVADQHQPTSGKEGACTRHCSPPPKSRSRSSNAGLQEEGGVDGEGLRVALHGNLREAPPAAASPSARRMKRPFDLPSGAGKKSKMAGSPMPPRISAGDDDEDEMEEEDDDVEEQDEGEEDEEEDEEEGEAAHGRGRESERAAGAQSDHPAITSSAAASYRSGWRSDDAAFYGPKSRVSRAASRNVSESAQGAVPTPAVHTQQPVKHTGYDTQTSVFSETEDDVLRESGVEVDGDTGVRGFMRRASEHLPMFRRPSAASSMVYTQPAAPQMALGTTPKAREPSQYPPTRTPLSISTSAVASPIPPPQVALGTCQPMLDDTPAKAETVARAADGGLAHRLEQTLGTRQQLGVSMAAQRSSSASSRPSTASRDSVWHGDATGGTTSVRPGMLVTQSERPADDVSVPYPQPRAGSNRPSLSAQGAATITTPPTAVPTQPTQPVSALSRAPSQSNGKVTFAPPPVRAVSSAMGLEIVEEAKRRRETRASASTQQREDGSIGRVPSINKTKTAPIRCPKLVQTEDLGWTEGALLNIRKNVGKGE